MGFSRFRCPEYLCQTNTGVFVFRIRVPQDCSSLINKHEIRYSLRTRCIYSARKYIASILPFLKDLFKGLRQGIFSALSKADLDRTIKEGIHQVVREPLVSQRVTVVVNSSGPATTGDQVSQPLPSHSGHQEPVNSVPVASSKSPAIHPEPTFSDLQHNFFKEKEVSKGWREKTQEDHEAVFNLFREIFGDVPVSRIDKTIMRDFKENCL